MMRTMPAFLSGEWFERLAEAMAASAHVDTDHGAITVQHVVTDSPDGEVSWFVRVANGAAKLERGRAPAPDVILTQDFSTASAVSRGELSPAAAFAAGRLRIGGRPGLLVRHHDTFSRLRDAAAAVHARTVYP
jgi:hypothetical protein